MTCDVLGPAALDYLPCQYGASRLTFRGPKRRLDGPYVAFLGGSATFGRFIEQPFPLLVEHLTGFPSVNFGQPNAGIDVFSHDPVVPEACRRARVTVFEVPGAANLSNRFYRVHRRRNDRFLAATTTLRRLYPEVDFSSIAFTQHLLAELRRRDPLRFDLVRSELQTVWVRRMTRLLQRIEGPVLLLWLADCAPPEGDEARGRLAPRFVTGRMLDALAPLYAARVHVRFPASGAPATDMCFLDHEEQVAACLPDAPAHHRVAQALLPLLDHLL